MKIFLLFSILWCSFAVSFGVVTLLSAEHISWSVAFFTALNAFCLRLNLRSYYELFAS